MATKYLDNTGLAYFWGKIKSWVTSRGYITSSGSITGNAATATRLAGPKHSYTTAANAAKNWYRIANANTSQTDTTKPIHAQFLLTAYNTSYDANCYEEWYLICTVFGRAVHFTLFGNHNVPFSQARILYKNTTADVDSSDRPAIDIYLNNQLANGTTKIEVEEVYNSGWTFVADGQLAVSTIPTGFKNAATYPRNVGINNCTYADYASRAVLNRSNITANITLADNNTYRAIILNCTNAITVTVPSINSAYSWFIIKNFNAASTNKNVTVHPSTTSVLIDDSNADIVLEPGEWVIIASKAANSYTLISDGRWKSQKADKATTLSGYGITDAKIANGTITLGSSSITPLTSHQALPTLSKTDSGSGNAVTGISVSNHAITVTKGSTFLTSHQSLSDLGIGNVKNYDQSKAIKSITRSGTTFTYTCLDNTTGTFTQQDSNTTYTFATGDSDGQIKVTPSGGSAQNVSVKGLGTAAYKADTYFAVDSNALHKNGDENISGTKTFTSSRSSSDVTPDSIRLVHSEISRGTYPTNDNKYLAYNFCDKDSKRLGMLEYAVRATPASSKNDNYSLKLSIYDNEAALDESSDFSSLLLGYDESTSSYFACCPSTKSERTYGGDIITRNWIPNDTRIVHTTGNETIAGTKTFSSTISGSINGNAATATKLAGPKHSYTTAANTAKNWYRIANASTSQLDTSKPIHAQFILTAYNTSYAADYYERWFVNASVFGRTAQITILGNTSVPFSQARILYENIVANIDANDRPALDIYLNYVLPNGTTKIEIEEVYNNGGWTFVADGQLAASTVPSGFENVACSARNNGVERSTYADYVPYLNRQISNITAAFTLADSYLYRSRTLNCTGTFTITVPSINSGYMWCVIKNKNTTSGVITLHPSTTSVLIDGSNADITLQPGEYVCIHSAGANNYSLIADGRWKTQKADDNTVAHKTGDESIGGQKTFTESPVISKANPYLNFVETDVSRDGSVSGYQGVFFRDADENELGKIICQIGGSASNNCVFIGVNDNSSASSTSVRQVGLAVHSGAWSFRPYGGNASTVAVDLGNGDAKWKNVYADSPTISTSDERRKSSIQGIPDEVLDAWEDVEWKQFQMNEAVATKGAEKARLHTGLVAQHVVAVFSRHGLNAFSYGLVCLDSWGKTEEERDPEGNVVMCAREAGSEFALRYEEALAMEAACQRRRADRLEARIAALEEKLNV